MGLRHCKTHLRAFIVTVFVFVLVYNRRRAGHIFSKAVSYFPVTSTDVTEYNTSLRIETKIVQAARPNVRQNQQTRAKWYMMLNDRNTNANPKCLDREHLNGGMRGVFYLYEPLKLAYCEIPKNGCTFWKRIMRFLNKDFTPGNISKPSDITREYTHFGPFKTTPRFTINNMASKKLMNASTIFMFTRDPYSRLWSAYLDKIFLPDFWQLGRQIVSSERTNPERMSLKCGYDVSFPEFIRYLVRHKRIDWHFDPIYTTCDPCRIPFSFIGKQEYFVEDAKHLIRETGMAAYLDNDTFTNTVENEIKSISENYLNLHKSWTKNTECYNKTLICEKLWKVFQFNGYIGFEIPFPANLSAFAGTKRLEKEFIAYSIKVYRDGRSSHIKWKKQKRQSLVAAYSALPKNALLTFQEMYKIDFELFDYDKQPTDIYMAFTNQTKVFIS